VARQCGSENVEFSILAPIISVFNGSHLFVFIGVYFVLLFFILHICLLLSARWGGRGPNGIEA